MNPLLIHCELYEIQILNNRSKTRTYYHDFSFLLKSRKKDFKEGQESS